MTTVFRIKANFERSPLALASHEGLAIVDIPQIIIEATLQSERERAAREVHANAMRAFLLTEESHCAVLEDDAILCPNRDWISFKDYDFFIPFSHNRKHLPIDLRIRDGKLPKYGAFAYQCSREFAHRYLAELERGGLADVVSHVAAKGLRFGSYAGNLVNHDNEAPSLISEERRLAFLQRYPDQKPRSIWSRLFSK
jgi:hypothetical protein